MTRDFTFDILDVLAILVMFSVVFIAGLTTREDKVCHPPTEMAGRLFNVQVEPPPEKLFQDTPYSEMRFLKATAYSATAEECDPNPTQTASGEEVILGGVAVSRDLYRKGWTFGKLIRVHGMGIYVVNDLMAKRHTNKIDIFMESKDATREFGVQDVVVSLLDA